MIVFPAFLLPKQNITGQIFAPTNQKLEKEKRKKEKTKHTYPNKLLFFPKHAPHVSTVILKKKRKKLNLFLILFLPFPEKEDIRKTLFPFFINHKSLLIIIFREGRLGFVFVFVLEKLFIYIYIYVLLYMTECCNGAYR